MISGNRAMLYNLADLMQMDIKEEQGVAIKGTKEFTVKGVGMPYKLKVVRSYVDDRGVGVYAHVKGNLYALIMVASENKETVNRCCLIDRSNLADDPKFSHDASYNDVFKELEPGIVAIFRKEQKSKRWTQVR